MILYYWDGDCEKCYDYENSLKELVENYNGSVILDSMDTYSFPDIPYLKLPKIIILGNGKKEFDELVNKTEIENAICEVSFGNIKC